MKKLAIATLIVLVGLAGTVSMASAQVVEILPQIGVSFPTYSGDDVDASTGIGFEAGGKVRIGGRFYVEPGIFWATNGADVTDDGMTDELRIADMRIPVVLGFKIIKSRVIALRIFGGAYVAFVTSVTENDFEVEKDHITSTLWSGRAGAGLDFTLISLDAGYDFGFSDLVDDPGLASEVGEVKRNGFFIQAGLRFGF